MDLSISAMEVSEADAIAELFREVLLALPYYNLQAQTAELAKYSSGMLVSSTNGDPESVLVAHIGHRPVGFCFNEIDDGLIWLAWFSVHIKYRRLGIGRALVQALELRTRNSSAHKIWCDCRTDNHSSIASLTATGFQMISTIPSHWHGQDYILWEKFVK